MPFPTHSLLRKAYRSDLSDAQWARLKRLVPRPKRRGRPRAHEREVLNGILYVLSTGCRWEDLPHDIKASYQTCNRRLLEYQRRRVWQKMLGELMKEAARRRLLNLKNAYHDASVVKSKRGPKVRSAIRENIGFAASNATSSWMPGAIP
jgi:transposase